MATTNNLRKLLHRKVWEQCTPMLGALATVNFAAGGWITGDSGGVMPNNEFTYCCQGASAFYQYNQNEDAWQIIRASGLAGTFGAGACGEFRAIGYGGTAGDLLTYSATGGTTTTLVTSKAFAKVLTGSRIEVIAGTGVGYVGSVQTNTIGTNSVITVTPASAVAFDATTRFKMWSGSLWAFMPSTTATDFGVYDIATDAWIITLSLTGAPTTWGTTGQLISTGSATNVFFTGTATAGAASTITVPNNFPVNAVANHQIRISGGTGKGQVRQIASNTVGPASVLTVSVAWTVVPDATSTFDITGSDDYLYLLGNNATTFYRYNCSTDTWTTLTAAPAARAAGSNADWISDIVDSDWNSANPSVALYQGGVPVRQNGRYLYCGRGGGGQIDIYDIALNQWYQILSTAPSYGNYSTQESVFAATGCSVAYGNFIYIMYAGTGKIYKFDVVNHCMQPFGAHQITGSTLVEGDKMFCATYKDGATKIGWLYVMGHSRPDLQRILIV